MSAFHISLSSLPSFCEQVGLSYQMFYHSLADPGLRRAREREPINGSPGMCPQWGPGAESRVRGSGGAKRLKLKEFELLYANLRARIWPETEVNDG